MNPFLLLFVPLEEALKIISKQHDKIKFCYAYIPKMNLNSKNPKMHKLKIKFLKVRKNLRINLGFSVQIPTSTIIFDPKSSNSSRRMDIIGKTPHKYGNNDPTNCDNMSNQSESFDGEEIPKLDTIPYYTRYIQ